VGIDGAVLARRRVFGARRGGDGGSENEGGEEGSEDEGLSHGFEDNFGNVDFEDDEKEIAEKLAKENAGNVNDPMNMPKKTRPSIDSTPNYGNAPPPPYLIPADNSKDTRQSVKPVGAVGVRPSTVPTDLNDWGANLSDSDEDEGDEEQQQQAPVSPKRGKT